MTWLGGFNFPAMKPLELITTLKEASFYLVRSKKTARETLEGNGWLDQALSSEAPKSAAASRRSGTSWRQGVWVNGRHGLMKASSEYPQEFAKMIAYVVFQHVKHLIA